MTELIAELNQAAKNLERAEDSLARMFDSRVPAGSIDHMSASVRTWRAKVDALRAAIRALEHGVAA